MEYRIIRGDNGFVTKRVNEKLNEGWELYGPPSMATYNTKRSGGAGKVWFEHSQAMVKGTTAWQVRK